MLIIVFHDVAVFIIAVVAGVVVVFVSSSFLGNEDDRSLSLL